MQLQQFQDILHSVHLMSPEQVRLIQSALPLLPVIEEQKTPPRSGLMGRLEYYFDQNPHCPHCACESIMRWGQNTGCQRYRCDSCGKTFNAMTKTPLSHLRVPDKIDKYLRCMDGSTTLRPAALICDISLDTSFHLRHRLMEIINADDTGHLTGISEMDETFFRENHKGERGLGTSARKRGGRKPIKRSAKSSVSPKVKHIKMIPVMVACDRENHVTDAVLKNISTQELLKQLEGHIQQGSTLCVDALLSHEKLGEHLKVSLKVLVTSAGQYILDKIYHIQTVNAYHSDLKAWINGLFKGVATKYLYRYLGWKRFIKTNIFSEESLLDRIAEHWIYQYLT